MKRLLLAAAAFALAVSCTSRQSVEYTDRYVGGEALSEWEFSVDGTGWETVTLPHSYNALDGQTEKYYRGPARYRTTLKASEKASFLLLEGAAQAAKVYLNGELLREHKGGYTPFVVTLTGKLTEKENLLEVVCDNTLDLEMIPISSDFNKNGGLHNPSWLLQFDGAYFCPYAYGMYRMHVSQTDVSEGYAMAEARVKVVGDAGKVNWRLLDAEGAEVLSAQTLVAADGEAVWAFRLPNPHLWNGTLDPYLYRLTADIGEDHAETEVGFRFFRMDPDQGFFLNGKPYPLRGVSMHQDTYGKASALTKADYDADYEIVRELGCNFLRLAHYPHNDYAFRLCDRMGIVVQTEVPWVNICGERATPAYFDNIHAQMKEMVTALYNHPSILFWGMWNELDSWGNTDQYQGPLDARRVVDETARLYEYTKQLDPYRCVGLTDDSVFQRDYYTTLKADYYSENRYHGWYFDYGHFENFTLAMNEIHETMGVTNVSEYGYGINPYCHTWKEEAIVRDRTDSLHLEEFGSRAHEQIAGQIARMPWLNFTSLWIIFDFPVADRKEGFMDSADGVNFTVNEARKYTNDKGLITRDRKVKKDVFYLYKAWWNHSEETVYITGRRLEKRPASQAFTLTVYSNAPSLTLYRNGEQVDSRNSSGDPTGVVWTFPAEMASGPTTFRVESSTGTADEVTFDIL